ncbi:MAG TPA: TrmH family RNA methyltransferase, partial [Bacteroidales bacterium]|nr:TrmH family RNA methyltransferase [Bacteroidales bacterium]
EFSMEWEHFESTAEAVRRLKEEGYVIVSVEQTEHSTLLQDFRPAEGARYAFIFGNEVRGVQQEVVNMSNICLEIPQYGTKHSLNVSVSIGVVLWDVVSKFF